ncbi:MAG: DUF4176 domain-containing protein [Clostridia bacterium]|nr:DUF4176 domain-containing protein [Clostridia bacterium]
MENKYLPIGSVVLLKNSNKRVMVVGLRQKQIDNGKMWDFSGCLYPEGIINPEKLYLFNFDQIDKLFFVGLQDAEGMEFLQKLIRLDQQEKEKE